MFLEGTTPTIESVLSSTETVGTHILSFGTSIFNWAISNPIYAIAIGVSIFGVAIGVVKSFTHK